MAVERLFVDTWGWLVLANDRDPAFASVSRLRATAVDQRSIWVTTDYVLDETLTRLFAMAPFAQARQFSEGIFAASRQGTLDIEHVTPERFGGAWRLRLRYQDKPHISFTDLTSFVVMRELGLRQVLTGDAHFEQVGLGFVRLP
jgi:predicted nucleic acid-binding protein